MEKARQNPSLFFALLDDGNSDVVLSAVHVLGYCGLADPPDKIYALARSSNVTALRYNALRALTHGPSERVVPFLLSHLQHRPEDVSFVVEAMEMNPRVEFASFLNSLPWATPEGPGTVRAISALGAMQGPVGRSMLLSLLAHPDGELAQLAANELLENPPSQIHAIAPFLASSSASTRAAAVSVLGAVAGDGVQAILKEYLKDPSVIVQAAASAALRRRSRDEER